MTHRLLLGQHILRSNSTLTVQKALMSILGPRADCRRFSLAPIRSLGNLVTRLDGGVPFDIAMVTDQSNQRVIRPGLEASVSYSSILSAVSGAGYRGASPPVTGPFGTLSEPLGCLAGNPALTESTFHHDGFLYI